MGKKRKSTNASAANHDEAAQQMPADVASKAQDISANVMDTQTVLAAVLAAFNSKDQDRIIRGMDALAGVLKSDEQHDLSPSARDLVLLYARSSPSAEEMFVVWQENMSADSAKSKAKHKSGSAPVPVVVSIVNAFAALVSAQAKFVHEVETNSDEKTVVRDQMFAVCRRLCRSHVDLEASIEERKPKVVKCVALLLIALAGSHVSIARLVVGTFDFGSFSGGSHAGAYEQREMLVALCVRLLQSGETDIITAILEKKNLIPPLFPHLRTHTSQTVKSLVEALHTHACVPQVRKTSRVVLFGHQDALFHLFACATTVTTPSPNPPSQSQKQSAHKKVKGAKSAKKGPSDEDPSSSSSSEGEDSGTEGSDENEGSNSEDGRLAENSLHIAPTIALLTTLVCDTRRGIAFSNSPLPTQSGQPPPIRNVVLRSFLQQLSTTNEKQGENKMTEKLRRRLIISTLSANKELIPGFVATLPATVEPREHAAWFTLSSLLSDLISIPPTQPANISTTMETSQSAEIPPTLQPLGQYYISMCLPAMLKKANLGRGLQHQSLEVAKSSLRLVSSMLQKLALTVINFICVAQHQQQRPTFKIPDLEIPEFIDSARKSEWAQSVWAKLANHLCEALCHALPDPQILLALRQRFSTNATTGQESQQPQATFSSVDALCLRALRLYQCLFPLEFSGVLFEPAKLLLSIPTDLKTSHEIAACQLVVHICKAAVAADNDVFHYFKMKGTSPTEVCSPFGRLIVLALSVQRHATVRQLATQFAGQLLLHSGAFTPNTVGEIAVFLNALKASASPALPQELGVSIERVVVKCLSRRVFWHDKASSLACLATGDANFEAVQRLVGCGVPAEKLDFGEQLQGSRELSPLLACVLDDKYFVSSPYLCRVCSGMLALPGTPLAFCVSVLLRFLTTATDEGDNQSQTLVGLEGVCWEGVLLGLQSKRILISALFPKNEASQQTPGSWLQGSVNAALPSAPSSWSTPTADWLAKLAAHFACNSQPNKSASTTKKRKSASHVSVGGDAALLSASSWLRAVASNSGSSEIVMCILSLLRERSCQEKRELHDVVTNDLIGCVQELCQDSATKHTIQQGIPTTVLFHMWAQFASANQPAEWCLELIKQSNTLQEDLGAYILNVSEVVNDFMSRKDENHSVGPLCALLVLLTYLVQHAVSSLIKPTQAKAEFETTCSEGNKFFLRQLHTLQLPITSDGVHGLLQLLEAPVGSSASPLVAGKSLQIPANSWKIVVEAIVGECGLGSRFGGDDAFGRLCSLFISHFLRLFGHAQQHVADDDQETCRRSVSYCIARIMPLCKHSPHATECVCHLYPLLNPADVDSLVVELTKPPFAHIEAVQPLTRVHGVLARTARHVASTFVRVIREFTALDPLILQLLRAQMDGEDVGDVTLWFGQSFVAAVVPTLTKYPHRSELLASAIALSPLHARQLLPVLATIDSSMLKSPDFASTVLPVAGTWSLLHPQFLQQNTQTAEQFLRVSETLVNSWLKQATVVLKQSNKPEPKDNQKWTQLRSVLAIVRCVRLNSPAFSKALEAFLLALIAAPDCRELFGAVSPVVETVRIGCDVGVVEAAEGVRLVWERLCHISDKDRQWTPQDECECDMALDYLRSNLKVLGSAFEAEKIKPSKLVKRLLRRMFDFARILPFLRSLVKSGQLRSGMAVADVLSTSQQHSMFASVMQSRDHDYHVPLVRFVADMCRTQAFANDSTEEDKLRICHELLCWYQATTHEGDRIILRTLRRLRGSLHGKQADDEDEDGDTAMQDTTEDQAQGSSPDKAQSSTEESSDSEESDDSSSDASSSDSEDSDDADDASTSSSNDSDDESASAAADDDGQSTTSESSSASDDGDAVKEAAKFKAIAAKQKALQKDKSAKLGNHNGSDDDDGEGDDGAGGGDDDDDEDAQNKLTEYDDQAQAGGDQEVWDKKARRRMKKRLRKQRQREQMKKSHEMTDSSCWPFDRLGYLFGATLRDTWTTEGAPNPLWQLHMLSPRDPALLSDETLMNTVMHKSSEQAATLLARSAQKSSNKNDTTGSELQHAVVYDINFVLGGLSHAVGLGIAMHQSHIVPTLVSTNALSLALAGLASKSIRLRTHSYEILVATMNLLKGGIHVHGTKSGSQINALLQALQNSVTEPLQRIPGPTSAFCALSIHVLDNPLHPLFRAVNKFILAKPAFDLNDVPMFFEAFNSGTQTALESREFILRVVLASIHSFADFKVLRRRHVVDMLLAFLDTPMLDASEHCYVLAISILRRCVAIPACARDMCINMGLLNCIARVIHNATKAQLAHLHKANLKSEQSGADTGSGNFDSPKQTWQSLDKLVDDLCAIIADLVDSGAVCNHQNIRHNASCMLTSLLMDANTLAGIGCLSECTTLLSTCVNLSHGFRISPSALSLAQLISLFGSKRNRVDSHTNKQVSLCFLRLVPLASNLLCDDAVRLVVCALDLIQEVQMETNYSQLLVNVLRFGSLVLSRRATQRLTTPDLNKIAGVLLRILWTLDTNAVRSLIGNTSSTFALVDPSSAVVRVRLLWFLGLVAAAANNAVAHPLFAVWNTTSLTWQDVGTTKEATSNLPVQAHETLQCIDSVVRCWFDSVCSKQTMDFSAVWSEQGNEGTAMWNKIEKLWDSTVACMNQNSATKKARVHQIENAATGQKAKKRKTAKTAA